MKEAIRVEHDDVQEIRVIEETEKVMDFLYRHRMRTLPPEALAEVLDQLIWCLDDNGGALMSVIETWLLSYDKDRVEIALAMKSVFPFREVSDMVSAFSQISARWPDLEPRCAEVTARRAAVEDI